ncbi:hypothetical protein PF006_g33317 [Phytophthora fragariae]|uniref:Uncharacterized protein n=1 Tax=Phytophthora fragariae TaxID=53985 RepID=A0A6A3P6I8_9STRA|nr:hypothetical protein PF006_g33317 [Phytophthora fragariae]
MTVDVRADRFVSSRLFRAQAAASNSQPRVSDTGMCGCVDRFVDIELAGGAA